jgi:type IV secretory pathway VirB10-like protein
LLLQKLISTNIFFRKKEETERKEEEEKLAKLKEEKAAIEAAKEKEKENSNKAEVKTEKKSDEPMETEDIGELDEADLQLPNGTLIFCANIDILGLFKQIFFQPKDIQ